MVDWMTRRFGFRVSCFGLGVQSLKSMRRFRVSGIGFRGGRPESQVDNSVSGFGFPVSSVEPHSPDLSPDHVSLAQSDLDIFLLLL